MRKDARNAIRVATVNVEGVDVMGQAHRGMDEIQTAKHSLTAYAVMVAHMILLCILVGALCRIREQVCITESLLLRELELLWEQSEVIKGVAESRSKLRYLQTPEGKKILAHAFGYVGDGEKVVYPLGSNPLEGISLIEVLPADVDREVELLLSELRMQIGKDRAGAVLPSINAIQEFERTRARKERMSRWLSRAASAFWVGVMQ